MRIDDSISTPLYTLRSKLSATLPPLPFGFTQGEASTITQINTGIYNWTRLPRWVKSIPVDKHCLRQRRTIIELLCEEPVGDPDSAEIGLAILECSKTVPCGSPFCPFCRHKEQNKRSAKALAKFASTQKEEMAFLTILHPVTYDPMRDARTHMDCLRNGVRNALNYRGYNQVRMLGAFEIDVKRKEDAATQRSNQVLTALDMDTTSRRFAYLIHLHSLVDLAGVPKAQVRRAFTGSFDKPYQVRLSRLRDDMSKADSIEQIARYMFKFRVQFSDNLFGKETGLRARYKDLYPGPLMREYAKLVHILKVNKAFKGFHYSYR